MRSYLQDAPGLSSMADYSIPVFNSATGLWEYVPGGVRGFSTSLPASPQAAQPCLFLADATNGVTWHLRQRLGEPGSYKWYFVGGSEMLGYVATSQSRANTAYGDLATVGPSITLPVAGDWEVEVGAYAFIGSGGTTANALMSFDWTGGPTASDENACGGEIVASATAAMVLLDSKQSRLTGRAAGDVITARYRSSPAPAPANTVNWQYRYLRVRPIRVG
jgi:hypothetical protein